MAKIPTWAAQAAQFAIQTLRTLLVAQIPQINYRNLVDGFTVRLGETVSALSDSNPDDGKQIRSILFSFTGNEVGTFLNTEGMDIIDEKIKNVRVNRVVKATTPFLTQVLKALTDENPNNEEQILASLEELLSNRELWKGVLNRA